MRNLKIKSLFVLGIMLTALIISISSCSKDNANSPDYIGTWIASTSMDGTDAKETLTFTSNSVTNLYQIKDASTNAWVDYMKMKGSISVNKQLMTVTLTEIGLAFDITTGEPTATMTTYKAGSPLFDMIISESGQSITIQSEYSVSGKILTLKTDDNGDGDYLDEGESVTYTKQ